MTAAVHVDRPAGLTSGRLIKSWVLGGGSIESAAAIAAASNWIDTPTVLAYAQRISEFPPTPAPTASQTT